MHVPDPVLSLSVKPKVKSQIQKMTKALDRFKREDPTFHLDVDPESDEMVISGKLDSQSIFKKIFRNGRVTFADLR
jgi:translation elongation factor EF-G